ncbi:hypothetical protein FHG87_012158 [Trinorchestia longiramus]|nr:hypothetical protein FHG87_012158 [Trinorchestia longiramus]
MNDHSCLDEDRSLWNAVVAAYSSRQDSICCEILGMKKEFTNPDHASTSLPNPSQTFNAGASARSDGNNDKVNENPTSVQRDILAILKSAPSTSLPEYTLPSQLNRVLHESNQQTTVTTPSGWSLAEIATLKTLLLREDVLRDACDHAAQLNLGPLLPPVAVLVMLPTVSQTTDQLSHPTITSLCILATQDPKAYTTACLVPALKYSISPHCPEVLAKVIKQMNKNIWPHVHLVIRALKEREAITENHLAVLEATCSIFPENVHETVIESVVTALQHVTSALPCSSSRVGRTLLTVVSSLVPHLRKAHPHLATVVQLVGIHTSPLQRAALAQLKKVS